MKVYYDLDCLLHNPAHEILSGRLVPYFESPDRVKRIKDALEKSGLFDLLPPERDWPLDIVDYVRMVHSDDYIAHIKNIYDEWVADGGDEVRPKPHTWGRTPIADTCPSRAPYSQRRSCTINYQPLGSEKISSCRPLPERVRATCKLSADLIGRDSSFEGVYCFDLSCPITAGQ